MILDRINKMTEEADRNSVNIAKTILKYLFKEKIFDLTIVQLAQLSNVSQPTVSRFVKAIGCQTYKEFSLIINGETPLFFGISDKNFDLMNSESLISSIRETLSQNNKDKIAEAVKLIDQAKNVNVVGIGGNQSLKFEIEHKLSQIGISTMFSQDWHHQLMNTHYMNENDLLIALSYSGETNEILQIVDEAKKKKTKVISITCNHESTLKRKSNLSFEIVSPEGKYRPYLFQGRILGFILWEILFEQLLVYNEKYWDNISRWRWKNL